MKTVFLDKDGTLIPNIPYNVDPELISWAPGAARALQELHKAGYRLIVITNQSGVARGFFDEGALAAVEARLREMMTQLGVRLSAFYYCPHHVEGMVERYSFACDCRKPEPGMLLRAMQEHGIDPHEAWYVGDFLSDIEAGRRAGCRTVLVTSEDEMPRELTPERLPHAVVEDLHQAARVIIALDELRQRKCNSHRS
ncbi:MAG: HAD family hydrolase [Candidatus Promineifilaceae bacterium]|nr:HAD family hydrolase [Candidatus Promineifilaceae bacterium]